MARIPRLSKASAHAEVAARYRALAKRAAGRLQAKPRTAAALRIKELTDLFDDRWGRARIEESDLGAVAVRIMAHHIGHLRDGARRIAGWINHCAPWLDLASRERLMNEVHYCPLKWTADKLAWKLRVTDATRTRLKLTTIGSIDVPKAMRIKRRAEHKRLRSQAIRRESGSRPRADYERQSISRTKPWKRMKMGRTAWYAAGKPT